MRTDRVAGVILAVVGAAIAAEASTFEVAFLTDPVGPKALPLVAGGILLAAGVYLAARPRGEVEWPPPATLLRLAAATAAFLLYAVLLQPLGFAVATTLVVTTLSLLFGGPPRRSILAAATLSGVLWYLFVWALGLPLPLGSLWTR